MRNVLKFLIIVCLSLTFACSGGSEPKKATFDTDDGVYVVTYNPGPPETFYATLDGVPVDGLDVGCTLR